MRKASLGFFFVLPPVFAGCGKEPNQTQEEIPAFTDKVVARPIERTTPASCRILGRVFSRPAQPLSGVSVALEAEKETIHVAIENSAFQPKKIAVPRGTTVEFLNKDQTLHQIQLLPKGPDTFNVGLHPGTSFAHTFEREGNFQLVSIVRMSLAGQVEVSKPRIWTQISDAEGRFQIEGLPAGRYVLSSKHPEFGSKKFPVRLESGKDFPIEVSYP